MQIGTKRLVEKYREKNNLSPYFQSLVTNVK